MSIKTTFRGGGGEEPDRWAEGPNMFVHHYPRVGVTDGGQMRLQFESSHKEDGWSNRDLHDASEYLKRSPKTYKKG